MKWGCANAAPLGSKPADGDYYGHTLERACREHGGLYHGWRCQWCGERFGHPGETAPEAGNLYAMEWVEVEELPTEVVEMAAVLWAMCSSTPAISSEAENALHEWGTGAVDLVSSWSDLAACAWMTTFKYMPRGTDKHVRLAEAESLIRAGEVTP